MLTREPLGCNRSIRTLGARILHQRQTPGKPKHTSRPQPLAVSGIILAILTAGTHIYLTDDIAHNIR